MVATDMLKSLNEAFDEAWDIVNSEDGWKEEHKEKGTVHLHHYFDQHVCRGKVITTMKD